MIKTNAVPQRFVEEAKKYSVIWPLSKDVD